MERDTIAAIATGMGNAGIGIVRVSGDEAISVVDRIFRGAVSLKDVESHRVVYGRIVDVFGGAGVDGDLDIDGETDFADGAGSDGGVGFSDDAVQPGNEEFENAGVTDGRDGSAAVVDEVLVTVFRAPKSYTRENVVEISSHGGSFVMKRILSLVYRAGARAAEAGEFTKRAFLNGRIDLSQAESVMDIIASDNERMLHNSLRQLDGALSERIRSLREEILHEVAFIEAALDDPEHYDFAEMGMEYVRGIGDEKDFRAFVGDGVDVAVESPFGEELSIDENVDTPFDDKLSINENIDFGGGMLPYADILSWKLDGWRKEIHALSATAEEGRILRDGIRTVIVGRPNVGKSSILNVLAREERAIVTDVPGTTRDTIEEKVRLGDMVLAVTDTAGIRETDDPVESIGVEKSIRKLDEADLILFVVDASEALTDEDGRIIEKLIPEKTVVLLNKVDLVKNGWEITFPKELSNHIIPISAKKQQGFEQLAEEIRQMFFAGDVDNNVDIFVTNARHARLLERSDMSLSLVEKSINDAMPEDFLTADLLDAYASLGEIVGEAVEDDLVEKVFSEFCMGK